VQAQQEVGIDEHALERELNPGIKAAAFPSPIVEEWQERLNVCWCSWPSICQACDSREDLRSALALF
jgi:hypothetical protein